MDIVLNLEKGKWAVGADHIIEILLIKVEGHCNDTTDLPPWIHL